MAIKIAKVIEITDKRVHLVNRRCRNCSDQDFSQSDCIPLSTEDGTCVYVCIECFKKIALEL